MSRATKYDFMYKIRVTTGRSVSTVTLTQSKTKAQAKHAFADFCRDLRAGVKVELLDDADRQIARNW